MNSNVPTKQLADLSRTTGRLLGDEPLGEVVDAIIRNVDDLMAALGGTGYMVLWDGSPCAVGAVDGTLGIDPDEPTVFARMEEAQRAIDEKVESYKAYARAYPNMRWPSPSVRNFQIVAATR